MDNPIFADLIADGYQQRAPDPEIDAIDRGICAESVCMLCGKEGLLYQPYCHPVTGSYRAFCVCPQCGDTTEF